MSVTIRTTATHTRFGQVTGEFVSESECMSGTALDYARMCEVILDGDVKREGATLTRTLGNTTITYKYEEIEED